MEPDGSRPQTAAQWVKQHSKHRKAMRQVLTELAMFIDAGNNCPSHKDIAQETGLSMTTVRHSLGELEKDGTITITKKGGSKVKGGKKDCYAIVGFSSAKPEADLKPAAESASPTTTVITTAQMVTAQMTTTVASDAPEYEQREISTDEYVRADGDAATRVNDLSLRAKDKNKNTPPITPQGDAPDGASVAVSKPKRERAKPPEPVPDEVYQRLMRGVLINSFGVDPANPDLKGILTDKDYKRAGVLVKWLRNVPVSPESLREFYAWYRLEHDGAAAPRDLDKLRLHYGAFVQSRTQPISHSPTPSAYREIIDRPRLSREEIVNLDALKAVPS